jgi:hypothetical protein
MVSRRPNRSRTSLFGHLPRRRSSSGSPSHPSLQSARSVRLLIFSCRCDIRNLPRETFEILTAPEVIAINQDPLGAQVPCLRNSARDGRARIHSRNPSLAQ